ncbi:peptidyl-prolyl cis-trans isomerase [Candidimonas sp. SYP-B2681]|uniref:peptidylprolyl isomerase n=1 Tax=Candidimonas sp. SYP-B2681 TaxID=2497686 RepID=UPI000F878CAE|nr:peptidylprolyl isomerase [Candidimonas sp. SYP-B2681]RTZ48018.1 peptidyl-prolyl cis-trans isomerase [Candidimonas sp. SYP-B2681]
MNKYHDAFRAIKHLLLEPFVHFLVIGALLFAVYSWMNPEASDEKQIVRVSAADVNWLKETWTRQWLHPPTPLELRGLITDYLKESLLAREALDLGLDENDSIVRRRLAQKMEFLVRDTLQQSEPSDEELHSLYATKLERFQIPARISFSHVYFNLDRRGERAQADARTVLSQLSQSETAINLSDFGDRFLGQYDFDAVDEQTVASILGPEFARQVFTFETGTWQGPIKSGQGLHLVHVTDKQAARPKEYSAVKKELTSLWQQQRSQEGLELYFADLRKKYNVEVDESVETLIDPLVVHTGPGR